MFAKALEYVHRRHPRVIVVENVDTAEAVAGISALLLPIAAYDWHGGPICPHAHGGLPVSRPRFLWIGFLRTNG